MPATYDVTTDRGRVRLLITDTDTTQPIFQDAEIDAFLAMEADSLKRAAAAALDVIASNESLVQKYIRLQDLQTNGPAVAKDLREHAKALREQAADEDTDGGFDWAEMVTGPFGARERIDAQALREEV